MKKEFKFTFDHFSTVDEISQEQQLVLTQAEIAKESAYVPYSSYSVGAALLLEDGSIIKGCNQENKSYPVGICAERSALFSYGNAMHPSPIKMIGIVGKGDLINEDEIFSPCGACRQAMAEYSDRQDTPFQIVIKNNDGSVNVFSGIQQLLPFIFGKK